MRYVFRLLIVAAPLLAPSAILHAAAPKPLKVFILAGQSNMDGSPRGHFEIRLSSSVERYCP